jgi:hypothetical protein
MNDTQNTKAADFDQVMLAMDVVDTLRHQESLVERELSAETDDRALVEKVRRMYAAQGIEVSDELIAEAVAALREGRFAYRPPKPGWRLTMARIYTNRGRWFKAVSFLAAFLILGIVGYRLFFVMPDAKRVEEIASLRQTLMVEAKEPQIRAKVEALYADAENAANRGEADAVKKALAQLSQLRDQLRQAYEIRIVSKPDTPSGVWRVPDANTNARNYYIIVEAVGPDGKVLKLPITSEENRSTEVVEKWGIRVDGSVFERVRRDKADDGIIEDNRFGEKKRGYLTPEYRFQTTGGAITQW